MSEAIEYVIRVRGGPEGAANVRRIESAVKSTGGSMKTLGKESELAGSKLGKATGGVKTFGKALFAAGGAFVAWEAGKKSFDFTEELLKSTKQLEHVGGLSTAEASRWAGVTAAVGGNAGQSAMAFQKVANAAEKQVLATHKQIAAGKLANSTVIAGSEPLEKLGISTAYLEKHQHNLAPVMELVVDKIGKGTDTIKTASTYTNLFGRGWKQLSPLLLEGKAHLDGLLGAAKEMGVELKGNAGEALEELREKQIRAKLATESLQLRFTEIAAKPIGDLLSGFSSLTLAIEHNKWGKFDKEAVQIGNTFTKIAEVILPHVAETFGHMAPIILKGFAHGFMHASLGGQAVIAAVLLTKLGLTSSIFAAAGVALSKNLTGAFATRTAPAVAANIEKAAVVTGGEQAAFKAAGLTLGGAFATAFVGLAIGAIAGELLNKLLPNGILGSPEHTHEEVENSLAGGNKSTYIDPSGTIKPKRGFRETHLGSTENRAAPVTPEGEAFRERIRHRNEAIEARERRHSHPADHAAPHAHGAAMVKDIHIYADGRKLLQVNARQLQLAQAAGE